MYHKIQHLKGKLLERERGGGGVVNRAFTVNRYVFEVMIKWSTILALTIDSSCMLSHSFYLHFLSFPLSTTHLKVTL